jgi:uncharacterized protein
VGTVLRVVLIALLIWLGLVALAALAQRQLIYLPDTSTPEPPAGSGVEEVSYTTDDGVDLAGWFVPGPDEPVATVLVAPGNAGNRASRLPFADELVHRGYAVLLVDYRGYGGNPGNPDEDGLIADVSAARAHLGQRDDVDEDRIVYYGESVGTGVVAAVAAEEQPAALVLRSPFPTLADVGRSAYPFLPVGTLLRDRFETIPHLERYGGPTLVIAGGADRIVPTELSREVARTAGTEYVEIEGAGHNDLAMFTGERLLDALAAHVRDAIGDGDDDGNGDT